MCSNPRELMRKTPWVCKGKDKYREKKKTLVLSNCGHVTSAVSKGYMSFVSLYDFFTLFIYQHTHIRSNRPEYTHGRPKKRVFSPTGTQQLWYNCTINIVKSGVLGINSFLHAIMCHFLSG